MKHLLLVIAVLFGSAWSMAQQTASELIGMRVAPNKTKCTTHASGFCYQVQKGASIGTDFWEPLSQEIKNFNYEEGYTFDLSVKITSTTPDAAGNRTVVYEVVKVNDKKKSAQ